MLTPARAVLVAVVMAVSSVAVARADSPTPRIEVAPWCVRAAQGLGFHVAFLDGKRRTVVSMTCDFDSRACSGAKLELAGVDRGQQLRADALNAITGAHVQSVGTEFSQVRWGDHVFTVHHAGDFVSFDGARANCR